MTYSISHKFIRPRHGQIDIFKDSTLVVGDDAKVVELEMQPYYFYKIGKYNFTDVNVPLYIDMKFNSLLCSADIVSSKELHNKFFESITFLLANLTYNLTIISLFSKELYDFYVKNYKQNNITIPEDCTLIYSEEAEKTIRNWKVPSNINFNLDALGDKAPKYFLMIAKNETFDLYKQQWWNTEREILNGEIT